MARGGLIGRTDERERLLRAARGGARLVTVLGPPGIGKTRLARATFSAPVCDAEDLSSAAALRRNVGEALGERTFARAGSQRARAILASHAGPLLLDGADRLDTDAKRAIAEWSETVPIVVTSRSALGILGETLVPLGPLPRADAIALLVARLRGTALGLDDPELRARLGEVATHLDGHPLALELVAPLIGTSGVDLLLERLRRRPDFVLDLTACGAPVLARACESAWAALEPDARHDLATLSVVESSFDHEAAGALLGEDHAERLQRLTARSWLIAGRAGHRIVGPIREWAQRQLDARGDRTLVEDRWALHVTSRPRLPRGAFRDLSAIVERALVDGATDARVSLGLEAFRRLEPILATGGSSTEHLALAERVADAAQRRGVTGPAIASAWLGRAESLRRAGDLAAAATDFERAGAHAGSDPVLAARAEKGLGSIAHLRGDLAAAQELFERARDRVLAVADGQDLLGIIRSDLGTNALARSDPAAARSELERAIELLDESGNELHAAAARANLGVALLELGETAAARDALEVAVAQAEPGSMVDGFARANLGLAAHLEGALTAAEGHYQDALAIARRAAHPLFVGTFLGYLGAVAIERRACREALSRLREAQTVLDEVGERRYRALFTGLAAVSAASLELEDRVAEELTRLRGLRDARASGEDSIERALAIVLGGLRDRVDDVDRHHPGQRSGAARASIEERLAERIRSATRDIGRRPTHVLRLGPDLAWFEVDLGPRTDLDTRPIARRLLSALAAAAATDRSLDRSELLSAVWPGEKILAEAARNRLKVAVSQLRRLGIASIHATPAGGYALDRCYAIEHVQDGGTASSTTST
jgi:tetratricopeptide (TPR) repeat protein